MRRWLALPLVVGIVLTDTVGSHGPVAAACGRAGVPTATVYLPNITRTLGGPAGWVTPFIVQNVGVMPTTLEISFYRFTDGGLVTCRVVEGLRPGNSFAHVPNEDPELPDDAQFAVVVRSFGASVISVVNEHQGAGLRAEALSYRGVSVGATAVSLPYVAKAVSGWLTTVVIQNVGTGPAAVTARFSGAAGQATLTRTIGVGRSAFIDPSVEPGLASGAEYAATITSDQPIAAVVNAHNDAPGTPAPMGFSYNGIPSNAGLLAYGPSVERAATSVDRTSRVLVQNAGDADATPTLTLRGSSVTTTVVAPAAVAPGRTWSFDPRFDVGGATPCPAAGAAGCMPQGQAGLVVSGGRFAVLVVGSTPASALGTTAESAPARRSYLPNVTRTLGGSAGWSTPILVQSAGATTASLRWYRFADGVLVHTQQLSGLTAGATQRIDPRDVNGLADSTQYAVVAEGADGDIVAAVVELSFQGGDGAMAYEGFPGAASALPPAPPASTGCVEEGAELRVQSGSVTLRGAFYRPPGAGPFPAVLVLHTRGGLNAHALAEASWFASQGFIAYAPDYFTAVGVTPQSFDRQTFTATYTDAVTEHLVRAVECLRGHADVSPGRVGAVGFSMGGYLATVLATRPGIAAAAGWYAAYAGQPVNQVPAQQTWSAVAAAVRVPLLLLHGDADVEVRVDFARRAQAELQLFGKRSELVIYPGVRHGYDQVGSSLYQYDAAATADSRARTIALLRTSP